MSKHIQNLDEVIKKLKPYLSQYLQERGIDTSRNFICLSPEHNDTNPSCRLIDDPEDPRAFCFSCSRVFDIMDAVILCEKKPKAGVEWVYDTVKYLADKYKVEISLSELTQEQAYELDTYRAYRLASSLLDRPLDSKEEELQPFVKEVVRRGWTKEVLEREGIGTVINYVEFRNRLKESFPAAFLDEIDLGRRDIFCPTNLIFTWKDENGRPVGFTARNLLFETQKEEADKAGRKCISHKYNNQRTTGLKCNIFQKGRRLYGIDKVNSESPVYIFEGQADVITARNSGLTNCVALAGSSLSTEHVFLLKSLGLNDIVLSLDSDTTGQQKQAQILEDKLAGHKELRVRLILLPEGEDPDSFIRESGIEEFKKLALWSAFEWRLNRFPEEEDAASICKQMIPFIVNEPSAVEREVLVITLARRTGITVKSISEELSRLLNIKEYERSLERQEVINKAQYKLQRNPEEAEIILQEATSDLAELSRKYNQDSLTVESLIQEIDTQMELEEKRSEEYRGFQLGSDLQPLQDALCGEWEKDVLLLLGGKENVGKSGFCAKVAYNIAHYNENALCIIHTIDDTKDLYIPRFVCIAEGNRTLTLNQVRNPNYWEKQGDVYTRCKGILDKRRVGYDKVKTLIKDRRLVVRDMNNGNSIAYMKVLIKYFQDQYPDRKAVFFLDNFHKLGDFSNTKDERVRFKLLSNKMKELAVELHIPIISTVEYTKLPPGIKPNNHSVSETVALSYDANFIAHLYSEVADIPDKYTVCHKDINWRGEEVAMPRVEVNIGKNKISDIKGVFYLDFWPASSDYRFVSQETVARDQEAMKQERKTKNSDDPFNGAYQSTTII